MGCSTHTHFTRKVAHFSLAKVLTALSKKGKSRVKVIFQNKKFPWFEAEEQQIPFFLLDLVVELTIVFRSIIEGFDWPKTILDPMFDQAYQVFPVT